MVFCLHSLVIYVYSIDRQGRETSFIKGSSFSLGRTKAELENSGASYRGLFLPLCKRTCLTAKAVPQWNQLPSGELSITICIQAAVFKFFSGCYKMHFHMG